MVSLVTAIFQEIKHAFQDIYNWVVRTYLVMITNFGSGLNLPFSGIPLAVARKVSLRGYPGFGASDLRLRVEADQVFDYPMQIFNNNIKRLA